MANYRIFDVTITTLNPLHIGTGRTLLNEYDFAVRDGRTYRLNEDAILEDRLAENPAIASRLALIKPAELADGLLGKPGAEAARYHRYVVQGVPRSSEGGAQLREQIKTPFDELYLPGSSVKGALRTALGWWLWKQRGMRPEAARLGNSPRFAAREFEKWLFGADPNRDLLRAIQVGDSAPAGKEGLVVVNARVLTKKGLAAKGAPIEMEAVMGDRPFVLPVKLDLALLTPWAKRAELPADGGALLTKLAAVVQQHSADRIAREVEWFKGIDGAAPIVDFYQQLQALKFGGSRCLVQLGWGTGWDSKTLGSRLRADPRFMERIMGNYRMTRGVKVAPDRFPASRRVAVHVQRDAQGRTDERIAAPLGWCLMQFKERK